MGEDPGDGLVEFGEPYCSGVEEVLDGEVEAAVAAEQRSDPESWADGVKVLYMGCSGDVSGICASSRTDAALVTCQVHDANTLLLARRPDELRPTVEPVAEALRLWSPLGPASEATRVLQIVGRGVRRVWGLLGVGAHLPSESGGGCGGVGAGDVGG